MGVGVGVGTGGVLGLLALFVFLLLHRWREQRVVPPWNLLNDPEDQDGGDIEMEDLAAVLQPGEVRLMFVYVSTYSYLLGWHASTENTNKVER